MFFIFFHNKNYQYERVQNVRTFFLTKWLYIPPKELALKSSLHFVKYLIFQAIYFFLKLIALSKVIKNQEKQNLWYNMHLMNNSKIDSGA